LVWSGVLVLVDWVDGVFRAWVPEFGASVVASVVVSVGACAVFSVPESLLQAVRVIARDAETIKHAVAGRIPRHAVTSVVLVGSLIGQKLQKSLGRLSNKCGVKSTGWSASIKR
jgi:hypothetical protein